MARFVKLFETILDSSIWSAPPDITKVWITMLAMADRDGIVQASVGALAYRAHVPRDRVEVALDMFLSPDSDSRTTEAQGRRIVAIDGGWSLINYEKYRELMSKEDMNEKAAARQQRHRDRVQKSPPVTDRNASLRLIRHTEAEAEERREEEKSSSEPTLPGVSEPPILVFPVASRGGRPTEWNLVGSFVRELQEGYPAVDVVAESRKALLWVKANPAKRKTYRGMQGFLTSWMGRVQDRGGSGNRGAPPGSTDLDEMVRNLAAGTP